MRWATYQGARFCTGMAQPGAVALMIALEEWIAEQTSLGIYNCRDVRGGTTTSLHGEGRAYDCGLTVVLGRGNPLGYRIIEVLGRVGDVAGVQLIIFDRKKWSRLGDALPYTGLVPHYDHLHIELNWWAATHMTLATWREVLRGGIPGGEDEEHTPIEESQEDDMRPSFIRIRAEDGDPNVYGFTDTAWWVATTEEPGSFDVTPREVNARQRDVIRSRVLGLAAGTGASAIDLVRVVGAGPETGRTFALLDGRWWEPDAEELGSLLAAFGSERVREINNRQLDLIQARLNQLQEA